MYKSQLRPRTNVCTRHGQQTPFATRLKLGAGLRSNWQRTHRQSWNVWGGPTFGQERDSPTRINRAPFPHPSDYPGHPATALPQPNHDRRFGHSGIGIVPLVRPLASVPGSSVDSTSTSYAGFPNFPCPHLRRLRATPPARLRPDVASSYPA